MIKTVNFCGNCPFFYQEFDDFSVGDSTSNICVLASNLRQEDYIISFSNDLEDVSIEKTPNWCPLKKEDHSFNFKPFSDKRIQDINENEAKIKKLYSDADSVDDSDENAFLEINNEISEISNLLNELYQNEEFVQTEDDGLTDDIKDIEHQLKSLETATKTLQEVFTNFGKQ